MISYVEKDAVLKFICENLELGVMNDIEGDEIRKATGLTSREISPVLDYFKKHGIINDGWGAGGSSVFFIVPNLESHDLFLRGGFTAQEELLKKNIEKLLLEIEGLKPVIPDKINTITSIIANITTALNLMIC